MNVIKRAQAPTPKFFKKIRNIGLTLTGVAAAILTAPVALPAALITIAGYVATAGAVATAVSQVVIQEDKE
ncbi:MAG TPA: hypothetical protein VGE26_08345 [Sphingobacteriaceae bacterium]